MAYLEAYMADIRPDKVFLTFRCDFLYYFPLSKRANSNKHNQIFTFSEANLLISAGVRIPLCMYVPSLVVRYLPLGTDTDVKSLEQGMLGPLPRVNGGPGAPDFLALGARWAPWPFSLGARWARGPAPLGARFSHWGPVY
jgi:hypothetical protein